MDTAHLTEFQGVYLEDSYFLGIVAEGCDFRLKLLFALTAEHPVYAQPAAGEQHCYREGSILIRRPAEIQTQPGKATILRDPDGSLDFGGIGIYRQGARKFRVVTEWFEITLVSEQVTVELA